MRNIYIGFLMSMICLQSAFPQFTYVQVTNGLTDVYESGNSFFGLGDIDNDGDIDIISVGDHYGGLGVNEDGIMVFKNNGSGTAWTKTMSGVFGYGGVALGDVNNDGMMDVAYGMHHNYSSTDFGDQVLEVVLGDGTGLTWTPWDDNLGQQGQSWGMFGCDLADVDNDGFLDLGSNSFGCCDGVWVYKNNGNGTWSTIGGVLNSTDNSNEQFRFGDFNRDGHTDFIANNTQFNNQPYQIWKNNGNNTFSPMTTGSPFSGAWGDFDFQLDVADVNHDGAADIAMTLGGYPRVFTFNTTTNSWVSISSGLPVSNQNMWRVALGDLDNDGHVDLVTYKSGLITIYKGNGGGDWYQVATLPIPETTGYDLKVADLDHNGYLDIVYWAKFNGSNRLRVWLQNTPAVDLSLAPVYPNGGEFFMHGSAQRIHWTSKVPSPSTASVDIEFSATGILGPYTNIVTDAPNSGTYQWTIPTVTSGNCYLRFTLDDGSNVIQAVTNGPFCIDSCTTVPNIPGPIDGPAMVCAGDSCTFSIPLTPGALSYTWNLPAGWTGSSTSTSITAIAGQNSGGITVVANFPEGSSSPEAIYVTVIFIDTIVTQSGTTLTAVETGAAYQWINCLTGEPVQGAVSQSFTPIVNGSYAVIITRNSCSDTSECHDVVVTHREEHLTGPMVSIIPNPTNGKLKVNCSTEILRLEVYSLVGKMVSRFEVNQTGKELDVSAFAAGIYFMKIISREGVFSSEIIKQD
ncbi:MAG: FG-GAP-like repeat-containing protein [Bacteroidales bacterium]